MSVVANADLGRILTENSEEEMDDMTEDRGYT